MKILCVCLGNICRSPSAEGLLKSMVEQSKLSDQVQVDSAGTSAWHAGEVPDGRSAYYAGLRGYKLEGVSRQIQDKDFENFDLILAMDDKNLFDLQKMCPQKKWQNKIKLITTYCDVHDPEKISKGVPDPYSKGEEGFLYVLDLLEDACSVIVKKIEKKESLL